MLPMVRQLPVERAEVVVVEISAHTAVVDTTTMLAPRRGPSFWKGHAAWQVPGEHGVRVAFANVVLEIAAANS